jgi:hypothetical protein
MGWILLDSSPLQNSFMLPLEKGNCWLFGLIVFQVYRLSKMETGRKKDIWIILDGSDPASSPTSNNHQFFNTTQVFLRNFYKVFNVLGNLEEGVSREEFPTLCLLL